MSISAVIPNAENASPNSSTATCRRSLLLLLHTAKPKPFAFSSRKSEWSQISTFSQSKKRRAIAAAIPMVPAPNTIAFSPLRGIIPSFGCFQFRQQNIFLSIINCCPHNFTSELKLIPNLFSSIQCC